MNREKALQHCYELLNSVHRYVSILSHDEAVLYLAGRVSGFLEACLLSDVITSAEFFALNDLLSNACTHARRFS